MIVHKEEVGMLIKKREEANKIVEGEWFASFINNLPKTTKNDNDELCFYCGTTRKVCKGIDSTVNCDK